MLKKYKRARIVGRPASVVATALLLAALSIAPATMAQGQMSVTGVEIVEQTATRAIDCQAGVDIGLTPNPMTAPAGTTMYGVTLTVSADDSRDVLDACQPIEFCSVSYFPDCATLGTCAPNPVGNATFVGPVGGTCPGVSSSVAAGAFNQVDFTFPGGPAASAGVSGCANVLSLTPTCTGGVGVPTAPGTCTITFSIALAMPPPDATYDSEAGTLGTCLMAVPPFTNSGFDTAQIMVVPFMGQVAIAILALLLLGISWFYLRRRNSFPEVPA